MCSTYKAFGSVGLVTSGTGRDIEQVRALRYPVFTKGTCCSHAYCHILHIGLPVHVGGLTVNNGDLLHGDTNGVARIPLEIASEVAEIAAEFVAPNESCSTTCNLPVLRTSLSSRRARSFRPPSPNCPGECAEGDRRNNGLWAIAAGTVRGSVRAKARRLHFRSRFLPLGRSLDSVRLLDRTSTVLLFVRQA